MASPKPIVIAHWVLRVVASGILAMGAVPKFTGGAAALAEKLPGGNGMVLAIGLAEVAALRLTLVPPPTALGSGPAAGIPVGAAQAGGGRSAGCGEIRPDRTGPTDFGARREPAVPRYRAAPVLGLGGRRRHRGRRRRVPAGG